MELKEIITDESLLGGRADEIDVVKEGKLVQQIVKELKAVIREHNLKSLSAPQIGYDKRIIVLNFNGDLRSLINPAITSVKGLELSKESCSSLPGKKYVRPRNNDLTVAYQTPLGKIMSIRMVGLAAVVLQHSIDHLDGVMLTDVGLEIDDDFENASEEERMEVIKMYMESLDLKEKDIKTEIKEDPELNQLSDAIDFMQAAQRGDIEFGESVTLKKEEE